MVVLIPGASGGFGSVLAEYLANQGMTVYGTCRNPDASSPPNGVHMLAMEVSDSSSIARCVDEIVEKEGRIDAVVNCVNKMFIGSVEEQTAEEVANLYDTNVIGALRVFKAVLPVMRKQGAGTLVTMSSLGGILAVPYMSAYTSSKFALEALTEALYHEVRRDGIDVVIMQPVAMHLDRPAVGHHLSTVPGADPDSPTHRMVKDTAASKLTPEKVAQRVHKVLTAKKKPLRVPMDRAKPLTLIKRLAPQPVINRLLAGIVPANGTK